MRHSPDVTRMTNNPYKIQNNLDVRVSAAIEMGQERDTDFSYVLTTSPDMGAMFEHKDAQ